MKGMGINLRRLFDISKMSPQKAASVVFAASVILAVIAYGVWQLGKLISPSDQFSVNPIVELSISDYDSNGNRLPNDVNDTTPANFVGSNTTVLTFGGDNLLNMARLEGAVDFR